jgi:SAM-dependent methyltransferase
MGAFGRMRSKRPPKAMDTFDALTYWETRLQAAPPIAGVGCLGLSESYNRWLHRIKARCFRSAIRTIPWEWRDKRVLDVGSGTGFCIRTWQRIGAGEILASDFTDHAVRYLRSRLRGVPVVRMDIGQPEVAASGGFDAVSAFDVFFHITDDSAYLRALRNVSKLLRPGGYFVFTENFLHDGEQRDGHLASRTLAEIESALAKVGLVPLRRRSVFVLMNRPIDSTSRLRNLLWRRVERLAVTEPGGWLTGAALFPLELGLARITREGPSTELMICRKQPRPGPMPEGE